MERVRRLARAVGAEPVELDAAEHDRAVAFTSHLPALVACALTLATGAAAERLPAIRRLVGPALRSATRVADAPPGLTADLLSGSPGALAESAEELIAALREIVAAAPHLAPLERTIGRARQARRALIPDSPQG